MRKKICVVSGSRAEYGLLKPLMDEIKTDDKFKLQLVVTGMHLSSAFGNTYKEIEKDGFRIDRKIDIELSQDTPQGIARSTGLGIEKTARVLSNLKPDIVVILGDRFESFAVAVAATLCSIPIAHLHGGELTIGVIDEVLRHSITKMSHLHFTSTEEYRKRVIQLGEDPGRVFNVGAIGLDNIRSLKPMNRENLQKEIGLRLGAKNILVTFHPVTLERGRDEKGFRALLRALDRLTDIRMIFTFANADMGGRGINKMIDAYVKKNSQRSVAFPSMGQLRYLSAMKYVDAVVGNSSSGIIEAPSFGIGTINIGDRQTGRIKAKSVIDCRGDEKSILDAFRKLYSAPFRDSLKRVSNPYDGGNTTAKIVKVIKSRKLEGMLKKVFYDLK